MKKILLGTSALALAGAFASPAASAEWSMRVGGYMEQYIGFATSDANFPGDFDGIDSKQDAEIWFLPSITLDNGIKFSANI
ncbi:MAG: porin, partial [Proteobacteria bacterium]|nr:porin [Pseudomonadota bacterium]